MLVVEEEVVLFEDEVLKHCRGGRGVWCVVWKCGKCLDCCVYSFVVWDVGVKGYDVNCDKDGVGCSGVGIWRMVSRKWLVSLI